MWTSDWVKARDSFRALGQRMVEASKHAGNVFFESYPLTESVTDGSAALEIDALILGPTNASQSVLVSTGLHGVEGIAGSAILRKWVSDNIDFSLHQDRRIVLLHVLNPYGFLWGRRVDQHNIDLNRSFLDDRDRLPHFNQKQVAVQKWLSATSHKSGKFHFWWGLCKHLIRSGKTNLLSAVASGQYQCPKGLFYGGQQPSKLQSLIETQLEHWIGSASSVVHLDIHTGIGKKGEHLLLSASPEDSDELRELQHLLGDKVIGTSKKPKLYQTYGSFGHWCSQYCHSRKYLFCAIEFGTESPLKMLKSLYDDNNAYFSMTPDEYLVSKENERLKTVFAPNDKIWREKVLDDGTYILNKAIFV